MAKTLRHNALGLVDAVTMAVAGTAPAYSLNVTTAALIAAVGMGGPAALLYGAIPMFGITFAYMYLNRWRPDAGANYTWVGHALNPSLGFMSGWALLVSNLIFMVAASLPLGAATLHELAPRLEDNVLADTLVGSVWYLVVGLPILFGISITARFQKFMTGIEVVGLIVIAIGALIKFGGHPVHPFSWHWFAPSAFGDFKTFMAGMLLAVFYFYGWDVSSNLAEETENPASAPGVSGVYGMVGILAVFLLCQVVFQMGVPDQAMQDNGDNLLPYIGDMIFPRPWGTIALLATIMSSVATLETTILQGSRSLFAMGRDRLVGPSLGTLHSRYQVPWIATLWVLLTGLILFMFASRDPGHGIGALMTSLISAIGIQVVCYYSLAGIACAWYYRRAVRAGAGAAFMRVAWPLLSAVFLLFVGYYNVLQLDKQTVWLSLGTLAIGVVPLLYYRLRFKSAFYTTPMESAGVGKGKIVYSTGPSVVSAPAEAVTAGDT